MYNILYITQPFARLDFARSLGDHHHVTVYLTPEDPAADEDLLLPQAHNFKILWLHFHHSLHDHDLNLFDSFRLYFEIASHYLSKGSLIVIDCTELKPLYVEWWRMSLEITKDWLVSDDFYLSFISEKTIYSMLPLIGLVTQGLYSNASGETMLTIRSPKNIDMNLDMDLYSIFNHEEYESHS